MGTVPPGTSAMTRTCADAEGDADAKDHRDGGDDQQHHQHIIGY